MDKEDLARNRAAVAKFKKEYNEAHKACPQCGCTFTCQTYVGFIIMVDDEIITNRDTYKNENKADCTKCDWVGIVHDLVAAT